MRYLEETHILIPQNIQDAGSRFLQKNELTVPLGMGKKDMSHNSRLKYDCLTEKTTILFALHSLLAKHYGKQSYTSTYHFYFLTWVVKLTRLAEDNY